MRGQERQPVKPLLPAWSRLPAAVTLVGCLAVVVAGAASAAGKSHGNALDRSVDSLIGDHLASHLELLHWVANLGLIVPTYVLAPLIFLACLRQRRFSGAALAASAILIAGGLTELVLKPLVHETIYGYLTFPSGHTTCVFSVTAILVVLLLDPPDGRPSLGWRIAIISVMTFVGCAVAVAVIGLNYHYFTDTVAGAAVGIAVTIATAFVLDLAGVRDRVSRAAGRLSSRRPQSSASAEAPPSSVHPEVHRMAP